MKQKDIFLESEGDAWFTRNRAAVASRRMPDDDPILGAILELDGKARDVLEVGCGDGTRLAWLQEHLGMVCAGVEPSAKAVEVALERGIRAHHGTADVLPFADESFDIVIFGFCLYLCDREDLFKIAAEADRVLRSPGWLVILDFFSTRPQSRKYHHRDGLWAYKLDYRSLFSWHPAYECITHKVRHHRDFSLTDDLEEWVALSVLRKSPGPDD